MAQVMFSDKCAAFDHKSGQQPGKEMQEINLKTDAFKENYKQ